MQIADPKHPDHQHLVDWLGDPFDPKAFSLDGLYKSLNNFKIYPFLWDGCEMKPFLPLLAALPLAPLAVLHAADTPIPIWPQGAPGALGKTAAHSPTLTPYLPANPSGAAILIVPGADRSRPRAGCPRLPRGNRHKAAAKHTGAPRVYVDLPCHLVHGQRTTMPTAVLEATGYSWEFAPRARDCCGSGGVYNIQKPDNAGAILRGKAAFFDELPADISPILATANHVCMMQWHTVRRFVPRPFAVRHVIQLLDPGETSALERHFDDSALQKSHVIYC